MGRSEPMAVLGRPNPWRAFAALTDWTLRLSLLPAGVWGVTCWATRTVTLDRRLGQAQRRSAIAHELEHVLRGPVPADPVLAAREEMLVERAAARQLLGLWDMGEALAWSHCLEEAADELWVDVETLQVRLNSLECSERAYLRRRLEDA